MKANLIRVAVSNYLSIRNKQEIFFTAESKFSSEKNPEKWNLIRRNECLEDPILPVSVFYGANASGKSNILGAITRMATLFDRYKQQPRKISTLTFALNKDDPSSFEYDFSVEDEIFSFELEYNKDEFIKEKLIKVENNSSITIYDRKTMLLDESLIPEQARNEIKELLETRKDVLILEILASRGLTPFVNIIKFFRTDIYSSKPLGEIAKKLYSNNELLVKIEKHIQLADIGIGKIIVEQKPVDKKFQDFKNKLEGIFGEVLGDDFAKSLTNNEDEDNFEYVISFEHKSSEENFPIKFRGESSGTITFLNHLIAFLPAFYEGGIFYIDELEESLHPMILTKIIQMFHNPQINAAGAQLIFTTHDTNLLKCELLRRDEIWFVEKNEIGESIAYPLSDFTDIRNTCNFEKGYLEGRFGAIPYLGDIESLIKIHKES